MIHSTQTRMVRPLPLLALLALWASLLPLCAADLPFVFEADVLVPMRDGTLLATHVFRPKNEKRHPAVLMRSPYGKPDEKSKDARRYTAAGYVMVVQDCRGRGKSQGAWDPFAHDGQDGFDTQEWIGRQPWSDGTLGTFGGSYVGWTQWASAAGASRHLKCMVPVVPFADVYEDIAYQGGAFQLALMMGWGSAVGGAALSPEKLKEAYTHLPLKTFGNQFPKPIGYLNDWVEHSKPDSYWARRGIQHRYEEVTVPALNIGGWYDIFAKTTIDQVDQVRARSKDRLARRNQFVIMGPWAHGVGVQKVGQIDFGTNAPLKIDELQFQWFEYWLRGQQTGVEDWPAYQLFVMGENQWRAENEWPLKRTRWTSYYLRGSGRANTAAGDGTLSEEAAGDSEPSDTFVYDPSNPVATEGGNNLVGASAGPMDQSEIEKRNDVLVYTGPALAQDTEITGPVRMELHAATTALDTDFTAKLVDVHPDGKAFNLCDGILRGRFHQGLHKEELLQPGKTYAFPIELGVTSNVFKKGHRIRLEISSSNYPRFDRNPNSGLPFGTDRLLKPATQTIHHGGLHASRIVLPIIPR